MFEKNDKCMESMREWNMKIGAEPTNCKGIKYDAGEMLMGKNGPGPNDRIKFPIENCGDLDRKI